MIKHYKNLGINPQNKTLLFSDSLDFERADKLYKYFIPAVACLKPKPRPLFCLF